MNAAVPLAVDVDGTLLMTDLLHESALQFVARHPFQTPRLLGWLKEATASIRAALGTGDFYRVRFGIGRPPGRQDAAAYVLAPIPAALREDYAVEGIPATHATLAQVRDELAVVLAALRPGP